MSQPTPLSDSNWKFADYEKRSEMTSDVLRALSHEHRLMILCLLIGRERSVGELETILKLPQPAVSQQLARLRLDDLVTSRRDGRTIYYTSESAKLEAVYRDLGVLLGCVPDGVANAARVDAEIAASMPQPGMQAPAVEAPVGETHGDAPAAETEMRLGA